MTRKVVLIIIGSFLSLQYGVIVKLCLGQSKTLTYQQVFERGQPRIFESAPEIEGWLNDSFYLSWRPR
jgi:hypothetical protein